jgi:hypothetical protein
LLTASKTLSTVTDCHAAPDFLAASLNAAPVVAVKFQIASGYRRVFHQRKRTAIWFDGLVPSGGFNDDLGGHIHSGRQVHVHRVHAQKGVALF